MDTLPELTVERAKRGDREAFRQVGATYSPQLFRLAFRMVRDEARAEDVVQEAFLRAYRRLPSFDGRCQFGTWIFRIATNVAIDQQRSQKRRAEDPLADDTDNGPVSPVASVLSDPLRQVESTEIADATARALDGLTALERAAFTLRHLEGCSIAEVSNALGTRHEASKQAVFRAVRKMRQVLLPFLHSTAWSHHED